MIELLTGLVDRGIELAPAKLLDVEGYTHIDKDKTVRMFTPPTLTAASVISLTGFVELIENGFEAIAYPSVIVQVDSHSQVALRSLTSDKWGRRQAFIEASLLKPEREFAFNQFIPQEQFNINLRSLFVQDPELDNLVRVAGSITSNAEVKNEDDGFTQRVTAKAGVHLVAEKTILPRVKLTPYRTFREAVQPSSDFIFRVKHDERQGTLCALFDADGGFWKLQAIQNVKEYLSNRMKGSAVEGVGYIPIIA